MLQIKRAQSRIPLMLCAVDLLAITFETIFYGTRRWSGPTLQGLLYDDQAHVERGPSCPTNHNSTQPPHWTFSKTPGLTSQNTRVLISTMAATNGGGTAHQTQGSHASQTNPYLTPLEPSFLNTEPQDEFVREIADWLAFTSGGEWAASSWV